MINNNKILTVSYGTFSCTLEGFDDSFGTMKAIAEYFRDLSADDRYFGAEPVQPDAQMLARIAEREIARHVEAREDDGRIVLSAHNTPQSAALVAQEVVEDVADAMAEASVEVAEPTTEPAKADQTPDAPDADADVDAPEADANASSGKDAAEPQEEVAAPAHEAEQSEDDATADESEEPAHADASEADAEVAAEAAPEKDAVEEDENDIVPSLPDADVEAFFADSATGTDDSFEDVVPVAEETPAQERAKADSIADKLKRIRAVVSQQSDAAAAPDYSEDQHADADAVKASLAAAVAEADETIEDAQHNADESDEQAQSDVLANTLRDLEDALDVDDEADSDADPAPSMESEDDDIAAILSRLEHDNAEDAAPVLDDLASLYDDDDMDDDILAAMDSLVAAPDADDLDDLGDSHLFDEAEDTDAVAPEEEASEEPAEMAPATPAPAMRTRVLKVKRATLEAAIDAGKLEEYDDEEDEDDAPAAQTRPLRKAPLAERSSLSDEAEQELARELAELEADMEAADAPAQTAPEAPVESPAVEETSQRSDIHGNADADLSRLMEETATQMDEPEGATRRDAFAHLRAAVAAKKADEAVGGADSETDSDEAYRDDLASVVRPRRPVTGERVRTQRPTETRPAPLKLVAEQRIDVAQSAGVTPVRPRRVAAVVNTPAPTEGVSDASSFADFAADVGADKLPDLLEAAAAYLSFVEGHQEFSRPQLMTKVRQVEKENFTREESLRSFGKLLREGKIQKLKGGRFQASDQIGFQQDARAAG
ncbi:hypothetical protein [uncultured Sulfitobacter sp.]|uniref:hypothetical protein n=1 Tax=uncultured Sulfitobacter sp. TaxID=191468 RepID=UPI00263319EA|nr:hypothetical protein [uncultured Sulfitobacter sp.]